MVLAALLLGFVLGLAFDPVLRQRWAARSEPQGSLRHRCSPPFSRWSDESCFVESRRIQPGDVWVCPWCSRSFIAIDGLWEPQPRSLKEGAV